MPLEKHLNKKLTGSINKNYAERLDCLTYAVNAGYHVSVSMEPMLSDPIPLVKLLSPYVDEIWIGMINGYPSEKVFGLPFCKELNEEIARVKAFYSFENIDRIVEELRGNPKVFWKESIVKLYLKRWWKSHSYEKINNTTILDEIINSAE